MPSTSVIHINSGPAFPNTVSLLRFSSMSGAQMAEKKEALQACVREMDRLVLAPEFNRESSELYEVSKRFRRLQRELDFANKQMADLDVFVPQEGVGSVNLNKGTSIGTTSLRDCVAAVFQQGPKLKILHTSGQSLPMLREVIAQFTEGVTPQDDPARLLIYRPDQAFGRPDLFFADDTIQQLDAALRERGVAGDKIERHVKTYSTSGGEALLMRSPLLAGFNIKPDWRILRALVARPIVTPASRKQGKHVPAYARAVVITDSLGVLGEGLRLALPKPRK